MMLKYIIIIIVLIIIFIVLYIIDNYKKIKELEKNINISLDKIKELLIKKEDLLEKIVKDTKVKELKVLIKIKDDEDIFELEKTLYDVRWKLNTLVNEEKYKPIKEFLDYYNNLNTVEESLEGLKDYYNSKVLIYNEKYLNKLFKNIYKLLKLEQKKSFKLRKIDDYNILRN